MTKSSKEEIQTLAFGSQILSINVIFNMFVSKMILGHLSMFGWMTSVNHVVRNSLSSIKIN
jgi:hypothetical protein